MLLFPLCSRAQFSFINGDNTYDFGEIQKGDSAFHRFEFMNNGSESLAITNVTSNNPHLKFKWSHKAVKPGKKDVIAVAYKPMDGDDVGTFQNDILVTIQSMPNAYPLLSVKGMVVPVKQNPIPRAADTSTAIKIPIDKRKSVKKQK